MRVDYHMHTTLSDGKDDHEAFISRAIELGLAEIGFSDHICHIPVSWRMEPENIPVMLKKVQLLKEKYKDVLPIKFGVEIDYIPGEEKKIKAELEHLPLDYVIGSIHYIGDWNYDSDPSRFEGMSLLELYEFYFNTLCDSARSGLFDIIGHADLIKKFGYYPKENIDYLYEKSAKVFKESNVVVEINTNGMNKECKDFYPSRRFIEYCFKYDVPVMINSDAHKVNQLCQYFDKAEKLLADIGYKKTTIFSNRERSFIDLQGLE